MEILYTFLGKTEKEPFLNMLEGLRKEGFSDKNTDFETMGKNSNSLYCDQENNEIPEQYIDEGYPKSIIDFVSKNSNVKVIARRRISPADNCCLWGLLCKDQITEFASDHLGKCYVSVNNTPDIDSDENPYELIHFFLRWFRAGENKYKLEIVQVHFKNGNVLR